ncbi:MAG: hypothetical protein AB7P00_28275, partial [Sandaracinaceae bacterium]
LWHRWLPPTRDQPGRHDIVAAWERAVAARLTVTGGELLARVSGTVVAALEPTDVADALDTALEILEDAEDAALPCAIAATIGEVSDVGGAKVGDAIARAQLLANRARNGELVLGPAAREAAGSDYLFGRHVSAGAGSARGITIDRANPRRSEAGAGIAALKSPIFPPLGEPLLDALEGALIAKQTRTIVLRGPIGAGASELISALATRLVPGRVVSVGASPGGLVPLASLRYSLLRRFGDAGEVERALGPELGRLAKGELVTRRALVKGLKRHLATDETGQAWVVLSPGSLVDGASLAALLAAREEGADFVLIARFALDAELSRPFAELAEPILERTVPALKLADARAVAESILGPKTDPEVTRRVAVLGGDTVIGVLEAARTLVASGSLVHSDDGFEWRVSPRQGAVSIDTLTFLGERLELLDANARRLLDGLCVIPDGETRELLAAVAKQDGIGESAFDRALARLQRDALATDGSRPRPLSSLFRWRVRTLIPPSRVMELNRFVARALEARGGGACEAALLGYYRATGGDPHPSELEGILELLVGAGYERAARQIAAWLHNTRANAEEERTNRRTPVPPPIDLEEEGPPSSEQPLDELLSGSGIRLGDLREPEAEPRAPSFAPTPSIAPSVRAVDDELDELVDELAREDELEPSVVDLRPPEVLEEPAPDVRELPPVVPPGELETPARRPASISPSARPSDPEEDEDGERTILQPFELPPDLLRPATSTKDVSLSLDFDAAEHPSPLPVRALALEEVPALPPTEDRALRLDDDPPTAAAPVDAGPVDLGVADTGELDAPPDDGVPFEDLPFEELEPEDALLVEESSYSGPLELLDDAPSEEDASLEAAIALDEAFDDEDLVLPPQTSKRARRRSVVDDPVTVSVPIDEDLRAASRAGFSEELVLEDDPLDRTSEAPPAGPAITDEITEDPLPGLSAAAGALLSREEEKRIEQLDDELDQLFDAPVEPPNAFGEERGTMTHESGRHLLRQGVEPAPFTQEKTSVAPAPMRPYLARAARALRDRDFKALESILDDAVDEGVDPQAARRVRAVAALARGDLRSAERALEHALAADASEGRRDARTLIVRALVALHRGAAGDAVRHALGALAEARRDSDARGEAAALRTLGACYRALGRESDAVSLESLR